MSAKENKDIVLRGWYRDLWNHWNIAAADELLGLGYRLHMSGSPTPIDRDGAKQIVQMFQAAFPDLQHTVDEMIAEESAVAVRWTARGTHRGDFQGIAATGRTLGVSGTTFHHLIDGKIMETWLTVDNLDVLQQLGAGP